ncbi:MAG: MBL fold metallo-hydrolase [Chitinophagaceae bacterium]|nr:MBL fold metallo-hydrolase [Chitinophagaceae bacterium]
MPVYIASINSGSNANCYYVGNDTEAILVDAGLGVRETEKRMAALGLDLKKVKAIFVSHEHSDHITGVPGLSKKYQLPVYITAETRRHSNIPLADELVYDFKHGKTITIGSLSIHPFRKKHDGADPHSFMVSGGGVNVGIITDIGYACKQVIKYFGQCHAVFLESNYCEDMLRNGGYPYHLQQRISGDEGHLSNAQALELFLHYRSPGLRLLILSHLSQNNNKPELVKQIFSPHAGEVQVVVASRYAASAVYTLEETAVSSPVRISGKNKKIKDERQLSLFP